jgi:hypothetical protein
MSASAGAPALILLAERPEPGRPKTRLAAEVGQERAARLAEAFLRDTLAHCARIPLVRLLLAYAPREAEAWFAGLEPTAELIEQRGADLGERLARAVDHAFVTGSRAVAVLGPETPHVDTDRWRAALERITPGRVVLMPAADGGYAFLGLATPEPRLFEGVEWGSARVLDQTRARAEDIGYEVELLEATFAVDGAADLERLRALVASGRVDCPETGRVLRDG